MKHTILPNGDLKIEVTPEELAEIRQMREESEGDSFCTEQNMHAIFESLVCNSELQWVYAEQVGALTDAPLLGIWGDEVDWEGEHDKRQLSWSDGKTTKVLPVEKVWGFMNYCLTSPQEVLADQGFVVFESGE
jgi:hypothetical protein